MLKTGEKCIEKSGTENGTPLTEFLRHFGCETLKSQCPKRVKSASKCPVRRTAPRSQGSKRHITLERLESRRRKWRLRQRGDGYANRIAGMILCGSHSALLCAFSISSSIYDFRCLEPPLPEDTFLAFQCPVCRTCSSIQACT